MVIMMARKLLGLLPWVPDDPRLDPIVNESQEQVPHWAGCLILEYFGFVLPPTSRLPDPLRGLIVETLEKAEFPWAAFRASIACNILHENLWRTCLQDKVSPP